MAVWRTGILNSGELRRILADMKEMIRIFLLAAGLSLVGVAMAEAACYVEYKAKRDNPLELFYEVAVVRAPCNVASARAQLAPKLAARGLTLLKILSVRK